MSKRPRQWPPPPGPVPDKRLAYADKPKVTIETEDGWVKVGWLDEIVAEDWTTAKVRTVLNTDTAGWPPGTVWVTETSDRSMPWTTGVEDTAMPVGEKCLRDRITRLEEEARVTLDVSEFRRRRMEYLSQEVADLKSWLLNVQPVEDPEIPGLYLCGICYRPLNSPARQHRLGCPLAPEPQ
jgi:hypothetical protein